MYTFLLFPYIAMFTEFPVSTSEVLVAGPFTISNIVTPYAEAMLNQIEPFTYSISFNPVYIIALAKFDPIAYNPACFCTHVRLICQCVDGETLHHLDVANGLPQ